MTSRAAPLHDVCGGDGQCFHYQAEQGTSRPAAERFLVSARLLSARLLGYANPTVTQNIYVDPLPEDVRSAGQSFKIDMSEKAAKELQQAN